MDSQALFITYPNSIVEIDGTAYSFQKNRETNEKRLIISGNSSGFSGSPTSDGGYACAPNAQNAKELRKRLAWLTPVPLGLNTSAGTGDRLGLATPGHVAAFQGTGIAPIFAQQSVRENARTGRKPQEVVDDAMWGVFQSGWKNAWGADADHLKLVEYLDEFVAAGYTFFTVDPGDHVDQNADTDSIEVLRGKASNLPWEKFSITQSELVKSFVGRTFIMEDCQLNFSEETILRAAVKYGKAVAHAINMYRRLTELHGSKPFDFEISVDETATATSVEEHFYISHELKRLGVKWVSLAPRFVGKFEKGVDYQGDVDELDRTMGQHAAIMRHFGSYKLSLHSGSDKFTVYPIAARHTRGLVHLKTAGTSYLEALRVCAVVDPVFFRKVYEFCRGRYETDRATYHVSAELAKTPAHPNDAELPGLLDQFDARQVLHVTFGSVLDTFRDEFYQVLRSHESEYYQILEKHFRRHLVPLQH